MLTNRVGKVSLSLLPLCSAASIYPGRGGPGESFFHQQALSDDEDFQVENEDDWIGDVEAVPSKLSQKKSSKFSQSVATEVSDFYHT